MLGHMNDILKHFHSKIVSEMIKYTRSLKMSKLREMLNVKMTGGRGGAMLGPGGTCPLGLVKAYIGPTVNLL